jgi:hypothetical protein
MSRVTGRATCRGTRTRGVDEVVDDKPHNEPRDVPRHPVAWRRRSSRRQAMSRSTCRGTQTRGVGEVADDEPCDDPRDEPRDVLRHPDARRR